MACLDSNDNALWERNERILKSQGYQSLVSSSCLCIASYHFKAFTLQTSGSNSTSIVLQSVGDRETEFDDKYIHVPAPLHPRTATFTTSRRMFFGFFLSRVKYIIEIMLQV